MEFSRGEYLEGLALLLLVLGCCLAAAWLIVRRRLGHLRGVAQWLAFGTVATAVVIAVHLVPGVLGILTRASVVVCALAALAAALVLVGGSPAEPEAALPDDGSSLWSRAAAAIAAAALLTCVLALEQTHAGRILSGLDTTNFQVPTAVRWLQGESIWGLHQFVADYSNATYPQHGNVLLLSVILPFERTFLASLVAVPFLGMAMAAVYGLARELRAPAATGVLAAVAFAAIPRAGDVALRGALNDMQAAALLGTAIFFLVRHHRSGRRGELVLAGLALGLAAGTKWYGLSFAAAILAAWAVATWLARRETRAVLRQAAWIVGVAAAAGGFWLVRNWIETGNPLFPVKVAPLGMTIFDAPPDRIRELGGFTLLHYATQWDVLWTYVRPGYVASFGEPGAALLVGGVAVALRPRSRLAVVLLALAAVLIVMYLGTPYSAFGPEGQPLLANASTRYALPALLVLAAIVAWGIGRAGRARVGLEALVVAVVLLGLRRGFRDMELGAIAKGALVVAALAGLALAARRLRPGRRALPVAAAVGLIAVVAAGDWLRGRAERSTYAGVHPVYERLLAVAPDGARVALAGGFAIAGTSAPLPAMGPGLGNHVAYNGPFVRHLLRTYDRPGPFGAALRRGRYDLVIVGRGAEPSGPVREEDWTRAAGYAPIVETREMVLFGRS